VFSDVDVAATGVALNRHSEVTHSDPSELDHNLLLMQTRMSGWLELVRSGREIADHNIPGKGTGAPGDGHRRYSILLSATVCAARKSVAGPRKVRCIGPWHLIFRSLLAQC